jgi:hypothetical protein
MNSDRLTLDGLATLWHALPLVDALNASAQTTLAIVQGEPPERTTASFNQLLTVTVTGLLTAAGLPAQGDCTALGQAIVWLSDLGVLEDMHVAFVEGEPSSAEHAVMALRDACVGQFQADYRRQILARYCANWDERRELAAQWIARQPAGFVRERQAWELSGNVDEMLESVGAGQRLVEHLRTTAKKF